MTETDEEWAKRYCRDRELRYLSHEVYITQTSHQVWIAVEDGSGRYEVKTARS